MTDFQRATGVTMQPEEGEGLRWCPIDAVIVKQIRAHLGDSAAMRIVYDAVCNMAGINTPEERKRVQDAKKWAQIISQKNA